MQLARNNANIKLLFVHECMVGMPREGPLESLDEVHLRCMRTYESYRIHGA